MDEAVFQCIEAVPLVFELHECRFQGTRAEWKRKYDAFDPEPLVFLLCESCDVESIEDVLQINDLEPTWKSTNPTSYKMGILNAVWELFVKQKK